MIVSLTEEEVRYLRELLDYQLEGQNTEASHQIVCRLQWKLSNERTQAYKQNRARSPKQSGPT